ncbi:MAG TPA: 3-oxoacyl-ACP reductase family protein [Patescibacteria group bacterium]|nr:3-oxoacyl-ACP reductase family protein [Patescibacteria group bacterium]
MKLQAKTAIITGGGTGIGKEIALLFAKKGANVAICGRTQESLQEVVEEITESGGKALFSVADVTKEEEIKSFLQEVLTRFGTIDILVNNAGVVSEGNILSTSEDVWEKVLCVDVKGVFLFSKAVIPHMVSQEEGKIINIASIAGLVGFEHSAAYCAAKGAVIALTRQVALDFGKNNITVNAIAPGFIETDMTQKVLSQEKFKEAILAKTPLGRIGTPKDVAYACLFLASEKADFITGEVLVVDGGWLSS